MKTLTIELFTYDELSDKAKENALNKWNNEGLDNQYNWDEAHESVKKFHDIFGIKEGSRSWLDTDTGQIDDNILNLKGLRLRTYILNNFYDSLYSGKYYKSWQTDKPVRHRKVKSELISKGNGWTNPEILGKYWNAYKGLNKEHSCELTGVCWDEDLLQPMYEFIEWKLRPDYNSYMDFETLINDCFESLKKSLENSDEYASSEEAFKEACEANEYTFEADGTMRNI